MLSNKHQSREYSAKEQRQEEARAKHAWTQNAHKHAGQHKQKGFTLFDLMFIIVCVFMLSFVAGLAYTAFHFIAKFW